jgi:hypothetical protein
LEQFLSFFDEGDEPTRARTRPARPARPRRPATAGRGPAPPDRQTARLRQAVALGALIIILILIVFGVKGCLDSRKENALKDYNRNVTAVIDDSDNTVGKPFFQRISNGARNTQDLQVQINQLRLAAEDDVKRAKSFSVPGDMKAAQRNLELALNLRKEGLQKIADQIPSALGRGQTSENAIDAIAAEMQAFLASDVVYQSRVTPLIRQALDKNGIHGQTIASSQFMSDIGWLSPNKVADALGRTTSGGTSTTGKPAPGLHGHSLDSTAVGAVALRPEAPGVVNRVPAGTNPAVTVKFTNGGVNNESDVKVTINLKGGGKNITQTKTVAQTTAGQASTVNIPIGQTPPIGPVTTLTVSIGKVPGETKTDNNKSSYTIIWSR